MLLEDITLYVEKKMNGLDMIWTYKEHNTELSVPKDFVVKNTDKITKNENSFEYVAKEFEKTHLKIINKSLFVKHDNNNIHTMKGDTKLFNISELKNTFSLGCLINVYI